jgi:phage terminase Nu1 subunit (DNA packaging protein)
MAWRGRRKKRASGPKLAPYMTGDQKREALTSSQPATTMAPRFGVYANAVRNLRRGDTGRRVADTLFAEGIPFSSRANGARLAAQRRHEQGTARPYARKKTAEEKAGAKISRAEEKQAVREARLAGALAEVSEETLAELDATTEPVEGTEGCTRCPWSTVKVTYPGVGVGRLRPHQVRFELLHGVPAPCACSGSWLVRSCGTEGCTTAEHLDRLSAERIEEALLSELGDAELASSWGMEVSEKTVRAIRDGLFRPSVAWPSVACRVLRERGALGPHAGAAQSMAEERLRRAPLSWT